MNRAYGLLEIKAMDDDERVIHGVASTITPDRMEDVVIPTGAKFRLPMPFLWQHNSMWPVGHVTAAKVSGKDIEIDAKLAKTDKPGALRDRLDEAWESLKLKLVTGLSIGFNPLESEQIKDSWGRTFTSWEWLELSAVTIPANGEASIQTIKSMCGPSRVIVPRERRNGGYVLDRIERNPDAQRNPDGSIRLR